MTDELGVDDEADVDVDDPSADAVEDGVEVLWTSDEALSFAEARRLTSKRGATVVMFAGHSSVGKTTAMTEIWTSLLSDGCLGGSTVAGANTAMAFERRSFDSRVVSGMNVTRRTDLDIEGFLHLAVTHARGRQELLFADISGEHFKATHDGAELIDEFSWLGRVDRLAVFVDGSLVARSDGAEIAFQRARRLLVKLRDCMERNPRLRVAVVLAKADSVQEPEAALFAARFDLLLDSAREIDSEATQLRISARPSAGGQPWGLDQLLDWITRLDKPVPIRVPCWRVLSARSRGSRDNAYRHADRPAADGQVDVPRRAVDDHPRRR